MSGDSAMTQDAAEYYEMSVWRKLSLKAQVLLRPTRVTSCVPTAHSSSPPQLMKQEQQHLLKLQPRILQLFFPPLPMVRSEAVDLHIPFLSLLLSLLVLRLTGGDI